MYLLLSLPHLSQTRPYPLTADRRCCQHSLKTPVKPQQAFNSAQFCHLSSRHTFYAPRFYPIRRIKTFPLLHHMSVPCLLFLTVFFCFTFFLMFYPVYHKTVQIPSNSEQSHNILFHNICCSTAAIFIFLLHFRSRCAILPK